MKIYDQMLLDLKKRRSELDQIITVLEGFHVRLAAQTAKEKKRPGPKACTPERRQAARDWMTAYWAEKRKGANV